jgi:glutamine amidotransferase-like uncharacterized protein
MLWPDVGIYVGAGTSHSWTWFADIFERNSIYSVSFLDEDDFKEGRLEHIEVLLVSGGDTFAIAEGLGRSGAEKLEKFITAGGIYIGSCAGAYLPLKSSIAPLNQFNFVTSRITNLTKNLPVPQKSAEKFCTEYGCQYIFHPVRDAVMVKIVDGFSCAGDEMPVPLFGGPAMTASDDIDVLGVYSGFTRETEFLTDEDLAEETLIGKVAIARKQFGGGALYLFGPHFEHPHYAAANQIMLEALCTGRIKQKSSQALHDLSTGQHCSRKQLQKLRSEISNARIIALALERMPYQWLIGKKVYDPGKIRVFLEAIWSRISKAKDDHFVRAVLSQDIELQINLSQTVTQQLRELKQISDRNENAILKAEEMFVHLKKLTIQFLSMYFRMRVATARALNPQNSERKTPQLLKGEVT